MEILIIDDNLFNCTSLMISFRSLNLKTDMVYICLKFIYIRPRHLMRLKNFSKDIKKKIVVNGYE